MVETLGKGLSDRFGGMLCKRLCEMLDPNMFQVYFRQTISRIQERFNLLKLPSLDEGLVNYQSGLESKKLLSEIVIK